MQGRIRAEDLLVRWRGEEFAILVRGIPPEGAFVLAERVRRGIEGLTVKHEANDIRVTMTIGAATVAGSPDLTGAALVEAAEGLLREAKASGPNRTCARMVVVGPAEAEARKDRTTEV
jgi:diguanylate cyclase (GGDEF)-like protein